MEEPCRDISLYMSALPNVMVINGVQADIYKKMSLQKDRIIYFDTPSEVVCHIICLA